MKFFLIELDMFVVVWSFRGNGASVLRIIPYAALHFMTYEQYRCWILNNCSTIGTGPLVDLLAGSASGGTAVLFTYPLDLARTKLAYQVSSLTCIGYVTVVLFVVISTELITVFHV